MSERSKTISRLRSEFDARTSYVMAKLSILVPSKIRALRLKSNMPRQRDLANEAKLHQSRISMFETPGAANVTLETLAKLAAAFKVGLKVEFVPFSEMLRWENSYSQDTYDVTRIDDDFEFICPEAEHPCYTLIVTGNLNQTTNVSASTTLTNFSDGRAEEHEQDADIAVLPPKDDREVEVRAMSQPQRQMAAAGGLYQWTKNMENLNSR
jgi:transcriptional regulator with XRE-family HTH domain